MEKSDKLWVAIISIVAIFIIILFVLNLTPAFHKWNAKRVNDISQQYIEQDAHVRVSSYEWFYDQYGQIQATANKVKLLDGEDKKGTEMVLYGMIEEYNSRARMRDTKAQWMPHDVPYQLDFNDFVKGDDK